MIGHISQLFYYERMATTGNDRNRTIFRKKTSGMDGRIKGTLRFELNADSVKRIAVQRLIQIRISLNSFLFFKIRLTYIKYM